MNLVYVLKNSPSAWNDNEIRYSLRSAEKNMKFNRVIIVGGRPKWLKNIEHVAAIDTHLGSPNTAFKVATAIRYCADPFYLMNDDFFILKPMGKIPLPYNGNLENRAKPVHQTSYAGKIYNTISWLKANNRPTLNYDTHSPLPVNRPDIMLQCLNDINMSPLYLYNSIYGNTVHEQGVCVTDHKIKVPCNALTQKLATDKGMFSISDDFLNTKGKDFLHELFPEPSSYET